MTVNPHVADRYLTKIGKCTVVQGLPEDVVAMLFGFFSRSKHSIRDALIQMIDNGDLDPPPFDGRTQSKRADKFHKNITIGYGHKSVGDHAMVHFCLEGVSAVAERDWLSARLLAGSSKSTRYVNFRDAGFHTPADWPVDLDQQYEDHCERLLEAYEKLIDPATIAIRKLVPYDDEAKKSWKKEKGWEVATRKRALDMCRDLLPASIKTNFGITCSATALREMLDKRNPTGYCPGEISRDSVDIRAACRHAIPVLLPTDPRYIPRHTKSVPMWFDGGKAGELGRTNRGFRVNLCQTPSWPVVQDICEKPVPDIISGWMEDRARHMPPDRTAESAIYVFEIDMPWAIHRDLGRQRMMTQLEGALTINMGFGADPLLMNKRILMDNPTLGLVAATHRSALVDASKRIQGFAPYVPQSALQYACPLASIVRVKWVINVRELVHVLGLRTTPQGHASYRLLVQTVAKAISHIDPVMKPLIDMVTNFNDVIVGRPG